MADKKSCTFCAGVGTKTETRTEIDYGTSIAIGVAIGGGFMPMTKVVTETKPCMYCNGTGKR